MTTYATSSATGNSGLVPQSGLVIVAKPGGMTSHDVVARMRKLAGTRRVGHAGTLDPMATGVLVIGIEKATRLLGHLTLTEKDYLATIRLGQSTVTDDAEGDILSPDDGAMPVNSVTREALHAALADLTGEIQQVPPKVSAIKVKGQRAYHLTRSGAAPELTARPVTIWRLDLLAIRPAGELLDIDIEVTCSSGTYIRALARDLGVALRTGGHLTELRRTRVGPYRIDEARTLEQLAEHVDIIPLARAAAEAFPSVQLNETETRLISHGVRLPASPEVMASRVVAPMPAAAGTVAHSSEPGASSIRAGEPIAAFAPDGSLIALVTEREAELQPVAVFVP